MNKIFYLPTYYWFNYNLKWFNNLIWYFLTLHLPIILLYSIFLQIEQYIIFSIIYIMSFIIFITFYEIFYIQNDYLSEKEKNSTKRFNFKNIKLPWLNIILIRFFYISIIYIILYFMKINIISHILILFTIGIVFFIHNIINTKFRFITFYLLFLFKLIIFFQLFKIVDKDIYIYYSMILSFFWTIPYFYKKNLNKNIPFDGILLYLIAFLLLGVYIFYKTDNINLIIISIFLIFVKYIKKYIFLFTK